MSSAEDFESIRNYYERPVMQAVSEATARYPQMAGELLPDVVCVALNRLPPRYIRHEVDLVFYLTERERADIETAISEAVSFAFEFVQARWAMRARR
ncbi:late competence development ComFB family protein [Aquabacterium sp. A7-Y]|uniref:late competence development ComFB family protein n=1 Tax=Aquabacterium sp. A7-Y TaxID=1349605 RepID=UPI00223CF426|nr:late competence development ComFB family protein [Aquabacterium sp. A7-Y]MCW7541644.1 late competence development ComFB family protein [Aquabacterium sp. A7-Y]